MLRLHRIHNLPEAFDVEEGFAAVEGDDAIRVFPAELVQDGKIVVYLFWQGIVQLEVAEVFVKVIHGFAKTVTALQVAFGGEYHMKEHACL